MTRPLAVVDTNVISYLFRGDTRGEAYAGVLASFRHLAISFQTLAELRFWALKRGWEVRRRQELGFFLEDFAVIHNSLEMCEHWAAVRHFRELRGHAFHPEDAWIAATALALNCPLVTHDAGDFTGIDGLELLTAQ